MMSEKQLKQNALNNGFQHVNFVDGDNWSGINKREYFAGLAMQGFISIGDSYGTYNHSPVHVAKLSVEYADALLLELAKPQTTLEDEPK